jgi:hypothetical protein
MGPLKFPIDKIKVRSRCSPGLVVPRGGIKGGAQAPPSFFVEAFGFISVTFRETPAADEIV